MTDKTLKTSTLKASSKTLETAKDFINFVNLSPSPFHAVYEASKRLESEGFKKISEKENWNEQLSNGGKYYLTRNQSALLAFTIGGNCDMANSSTLNGGFLMIGAHTDSPCLKVKPISKLESQGWLQVGVECYGGALFHTWFDRDLGVAGRVFIKKDDSKFESKLVLINRPLLRIPTLAIHLDREVDKGFSFNKETHLIPVLATKVKEQLESCHKNEQTKHHSIFLQLLAKELNVAIDDIYDFELCLFDTQGANLGGILNEFIFSPRLDNLCCSYASLVSLIRSCDSIQKDTSVRLIALFDNEEVGSNSLMGAGSNFVQQTMDRILSAFSCASASPEILRKSLLISADMAHGVHPNYVEKHEPNHRPKFHLGPVIKYNANQRYATSSETAFLLKQIARLANVDVQEFVVRQDSPCGSTIGPILATNTGIRTIDVGIAQLSMHSIREMCGTEDLEKTIQWFHMFFSKFLELDSKVQTD